MKLHEAMQKVLNENERPMRPSEIADALNQNKWYQKKDGSRIDSSQIRLRAKNYTDDFEVKDGLIYTKGGSYKTISKPSEATPITKTESTSKKIMPTLDDVSLESKYSVFDPAKTSNNSIPSKPGVYVICLKPDCTLPDVGIPFTTNVINGNEVIYIGIAAKDLYQRLINQHFFGNNAGRSTFRKSTGSMLGYSKVPRDKNPKTRKTKFSEADEMRLTNWMQQSLIVYYQLHQNPDSIETVLINEFNPPLNLLKNHNTINKQFRAHLSTLRTK
jgi:hypothetical protein